MASVKASVAIRCGVRTLSVGCMSAKVDFIEANGEQEGVRVSATNNRLIMKNSSLQ